MMEFCKTKEEYRYEVVADMLLLEEVACTTYGIRLLRIVDGREIPMTTIADISTDRLVVEGLAGLFNKEGLEPVHFMDAVEDSLAEQ